MFSKIKKYVIGFFVLCGGVLFAFLSGRSAGRKDEKLKGLKKESKKHFPATGSATLSGVIVEADTENGLAKNIENFIYGGDLKNSN